MPKRVVRLYDTVSVPALDKSPEKVKFINDNFFGPKRTSSLMVKVAATHAGMITKNNGFYLPDRMASGAGSMLLPFPKPILLHHDSHKDAIGRIVSAEYVNTSNSLLQHDSKFKDFTDPKVSFFAKLNLIDALLQDGHLQNDSFQGLGYLSVVAKITDPDAIQKIADDRYMTVSIGASTDKAVCSICKVDWVDEGPCEHRPGQMYDEKPAFIIAGNLTYEELSFVNSPADPFARVIEVQNSSEDIQRIEFEKSEDDNLVDAEAQIYLITDDQHFAANLLENKEGESTAEAVKNLLQEVEESSEEDVEVEAKEDDSKVNDEDGAINVGGRHQHLKDAPTGEHYNCVDDELPGDHMHTEDNSSGLHFHYVGDATSGKHKHDGKNPMGVHEHPEREEDDNIDKEASGTDNIDGDSEEDAAHRSPSAGSYSGTSKKKKKKKMKNSMEEDTVEKEIKQEKTDATEEELTENKLETKEEIKEDSVEINASNTEDEEGNAEVIDKTEEEEIVSEEKIEDESEESTEEPAEKEEPTEEIVDESETEEKIEDVEEEKEEVEIKDASEILSALALTDIVDAEKLTTKIKEAYDFFTDKQVTEAVEEIQIGASKEGFEDINDNIFLLIQRVLGIIEDRDFDADAMYVEFEKTLDEADASDAKLSTSARKKLPNSAFCGPNRSFPIPDCAHVAAAHQLVDEAKVTAAAKSRILTCASRKAKALGCGKDKVEVKPKIDETQETQTETQELTCDTFKALSNEQVETVDKWVQAEKEERELVSEEVITDTEELETLKEREETLVAEKDELRAQLSALRSELKDVYGECADLEDAKADLLEKLHTERAQRLCDLRVLTGEIKDQGELEQKLEEEVEKASEVVEQGLKDISSKVNLYEIFDKVDDGMSNKPEGTVEDPTLSNNEEKQEPDSRIKIREHYRKLLASKGQRDADSYKNLVLRSGLVPTNFKF